ncbi:MAG: hypothetical protein K2M22_10185 [Lachnospiraceae bacterium]|nr:hypothetical protein [Lachnospiraceae bacterium]
MIYGVGDCDNPAYDYSSQLKPAKNAESQEKFSLDRQKEQEYTAKKEEKGENKKIHEKPGVRSKTLDGVRLDLSGDRDTQKREPAPKEQPSSGTSFFSFVQNLLAAVKDFFYRVWNDEPAQAFSEDVTPEEAERYTEEYYAMKGISPERTVKKAEEAHPETEAADPTTELSVETPQNHEAYQAARDEKIRGHLRSGNLEQVISLLTDDGRRSVAKNSTLLTYYDKSGKLTQINASDRERILHGDRNVRKL